MKHHTTTQIKTQSDLSGCMKWWVCNTVVNILDMPAPAVWHTADVQCTLNFTRQRQEEEWKNPDDVVCAQARHFPQHKMCWPHRKPPRGDNWQLGNIQPVHQVNISLINRVVMKHINSIFAFYDTKHFTTAKNTINQTGACTGLLSIMLYKRSLALTVAAIKSTA